MSRHSLTQIDLEARVHILSEIDAEKRTAICAKCGPVRIKWDPSLFSPAGHPGVLPGSGAYQFKNERPQENTKIVYEHMRRQAAGAVGRWRSWVRMDSVFLRCTG